MDWHMYLILLIAVILFIGIVLFAQRKSKDPVSFWNRKNASIYLKEPHLKGKWEEPYYLKFENDTTANPAYRNLPGNICYEYDHMDD